MDIKKTEWVIKSKDDIVYWYLEEGVFHNDPFKADADNSLVYYESLVTNYVAYHADKFTGSVPRRIWHDLTLHDWRLDKIEEPKSKPGPKSRVRPDLILQFDSELCMIEVKYHPQSPDIEKKPRLKTLKPIDEQVDIYTKRLSNVLKLGWFPNCSRIRPFVFWAFYYPRTRFKPHLDRKYASWPVDRRKR